jgi:hypothetical protein
VKIKAIPSLLVLLASMQLSTAQVLVGPVVGGQYSWVSFDDKDFKDVYTVKPVPGFHAGASLSFLVRKRFFLHTSILYSVKGKIIEGKNDALLRNEVHNHYIDVPILYTVDFKARLGKGKEFKYYLGLGPNISYWLGGKGKIYDTDFNEAQLEEQSYKIVFNKTLEETQPNQMTVSDPNRLQLGLNLAAGFLFEPFGFQKVMFTVRYELGHSFFSRTSDGNFQQTYYQDVLRSRTQGFRVSLAYLIDLRVEDRKKGKSTIKRRNL